MPNIDRLNGVTATDVASVNNHNASAITSINGKDLVTASLLLDSFGGNVLVAYSFRKLSSSYTGAAIRVRETGFNTETDIGFDANGNLDTAALLAHCSYPNASGYITKWYDQAGNNRDGVQTNANRQIQVVSSNALITKNSLPTTQGANNDCVIISGIPLTAQPITSFEVYAHNSASAAGNSQTFAGYSVYPPNGNFITNRTHRFVKFGVITNDGTGQSTCLSPNNSNTDLHVITRMINGSSSVLRVDQSAQTLNNTPQSGAKIGGANQDRIGDINTNSYNGNLSEVIVFAADKTSEFTGIETDIQTYYSIP